MKSIRRALSIVVLVISVLLGLIYGRELGAREARNAIAVALGLDKADRVRVKSISRGLGGEAVVEATVEAAFKLTQNKQGNWNAVEVRTGDRRWESFELLETAIQKEKTLRTTAELRTIATALEAFRREKGFYVTAGTGAALIDNLAPQYLGTVLRLDAWSQELDYKGTAEHYRLASSGPDRTPNTADDIVMEDGRLLKGAE